MSNVMQIGSLDAWGGERGKQFLEKEIGAQVAGISVNTTEPGGQSAYWHSHAKLEEIYVIVDGRGEFALGDEVLPLEAGTVVSLELGVLHPLGALPASTAMPCLWVISAGEALADVGHDGVLDRERSFPWNA
jgi:quercetin dioxygenase-like cupin family protein